RVERDVLPEDTLASAEVVHEVHAAVEAEEGRAAASSEPEAQRVDGTAGRVRPHAGLRAESSRSMGPSARASRATDPVRTAATTTSGVRLIRPCSLARGELQARIARSS